MAVGQNDPLSYVPLTSPPHRCIWPPESVRQNSETAVSGIRGHNPNTLPDAIVSIDETAAEYSVCRQTKAGKVYVAEFRALQEATLIALPARG